MCLSACSRPGTSLTVFTCRRQRFSPPRSPRTPRDPATGRRAAPSRRNARRRRDVGRRLGRLRAPPSFSASSRFRTRRRRSRGAWARRVSGCEGWKGAGTMRRLGLVMVGVRGLKVGWDVRDLDLCMKKKTRACRYGYIHLAIVSVSQYKLTDSKMVCVLG